MIRRIRGRFVGLLPESVLLDVSGLTYEVFIPPHVHQSYMGRPTGGEVEFCTYHYLASDPSKSIPVLLGFENETQREFFELLTEVPRMGPRAALRAFSLPVAALAKAIEHEDVRVLKSLPGVGAQKAKEMVAKLGGRMAPYMSAGDLEAGAAGEHPLEQFEQNAVEMLVQLTMSPADATAAVRKVRAAEPDLVDPGAIVRKVFQSR